MTNSDFSIFHSGLSVSAAKKIKIIVNIDLAHRQL